MAAREERRRRGPAPIASFDHDVSDESSPETKQIFQLPEIREDSSAAGPSVSATVATGEGLAVAGEARARSHSTPGLTTAAPRIDISRASSSSHHDSRDSSPELALFAGLVDAPDHLGFREDGALELRSSTEELAFLEPAPGESTAPPAPPAAPAVGGASIVPPPPPPPQTDSRRHSRKDSQGSEAALLGIAGRTSRLSSVGSQCSALSAYSHTSRVSRLSVVSATSRSPSPHKMLLETSFCGPKPIENDPEICAAAVEEHLLEIVQMQAPSVPTAPVAAAADAAAASAPDARDRREVRTEARVEPARPARPAPAPDPPAVAVTQPADDKREKESRNRARVEERRARSRERRDRSEPEVYKGRNKSKDVIRIRLKPDEEYDDDDNDDDDEESDRTLIAASARKPDTLALGVPRTTRVPSAPATDRVTRSPSPHPPLPSRKSSFCSLFKSKETIASPDSPSDALRRKKSMNEGRSRSRSKSRDRSAPPSSTGKLRGSVLSLFKTPRRSAAASPSPSSRGTSPGPTAATASVPPPPSMRGLKYYEDSHNGIIHIPLRTPPDEPETSRAQSEVREPARPASAPCSRPAPAPCPRPAPASAKPMTRTVLPDGSIIIPLHSPTERELPIPPDSRQQVAAVVEPPPIGWRQMAAVVEPPPSGWRQVAADVEPAPSTHEPHEIPETEPKSKLESKKSTPEAAPSTESTPPAPTTTPPEQTESLAATPANGSTRPRRKERIVFTTHVGSTEQVFSTQFSITKTPSVTSEISESFPSLQEEVRGAGAAVLRDTHITAEAPLAVGTGGDASPGAGARDSSESEGSSEAGGGAGAARAGDAEARGLVVQESFEDELPYVPTTLPQERPRAVPMLPVRDRTPHTNTTASVERPRSGARGAGTPLAPPPPPPAPAAGAPPPHQRLRIRLPRRASAATSTTITTTTTTAAAATRPRSRTRSGSGSGDGSESRKSEWIDFSEVPERRRAARRIQTVPAAASPDEPPLGYVEPDQCRCECHRADEPTHQHSSPEEPEQARPFTADLGVREESAS